MTVGELIEELKVYDQNSEIKLVPIITTDNTYGASLMVNDYTVIDSNRLIWENY